MAYKKELDPNGDNRYRGNKHKGNDGALIAVGAICLFNGLSWLGKKVTNFFKDNKKDNKKKVNYN